MNDLISREKLLEDMSKVLADILISSIRGGCSFDSLKDKIMNSIKEQPTAYDMDKVVGEIKRAADEDGIVVCVDGKPQIAKHKAIGIVKAGRVNEYDK